ncbi:MAG TPA: hypothetical protein VEC16_04045 [Alphaproteobacteria bacterium]|nr:hypothetical protein [Alphaproteobacteria bacterium]
MKYDKLEKLSRELKEARKKAEKIEEELKPLYQKRSEYNRKIEDLEGRIFEKHPSDHSLLSEALGRLNEEKMEKVPTDLLTFVMDSFISGSDAIKFYNEYKKRTQEHYDKILLELDTKKKEELYRSNLDYLNKKNKKDMSEREKIAKEWAEKSIQEEKEKFLSPEKMVPHTFIVIDDKYRIGKRVIGLWERVIPEIRKYRRN